MVRRISPPPPDESAAARAPLIAEESRSHHFGAVISKSGLKLKHAYRLVNTTKHDIKVTNLVNRRPCCGEVRIGKTMLHPGDETVVEVTLSIRQEFGDVVHDTVVRTEPAPGEELVLRTVARAYPAIRIEEVTPANGTVLLSSDRPKSVEFRVLAYGSSTQAPIDLDRVELHSAIKVDWLGPKVNAVSQEDLTVETRRFAALLDPAGPPGERKAAIVLQDDERPCYTHVVSWEAASPLTASPKMVVMKPGERDYRVVIQSRDQKPFRVTRIECKVPGVHGRAADTTAALTQMVEVGGQGAVRPQDRRGTIAVFTDHPSQARVDLPFVVID
ncbi:MAG: hypothetical protein ACLQVF_44690 [Isosphaeraceae bacterium]